MPALGWSSQPAHKDHEGDHQDGVGKGDNGVGRHDGTDLTGRLTRGNAATTAVLSLAEDQFLPAGRSAPIGRTVATSSERPAYAQRIPVTRVTLIRLGCPLQLKIHRQAGPLAQPRADRDAEQFPPFPRRARGGKLIVVPHQPHVHVPVIGRPAHASRANQVGRVAERPADESAGTVQVVKLDRGELIGARFGGHVAGCVQKKGSR